MGVHLLVHEWVSQNVQRSSEPLLTSYFQDDIIRPYLESLEDYRASGKAKPKPLMLLVLTDGRADDPITVEELIIETADRLNQGRWPNFQLGIQFVQLGHDREGLSAHLPFRMLY
jgi:hypothetical protein